LALDERVACRVPGTDRVGEIVEHEFAVVGLDGQDRMALAITTNINSFVSLEEFGPEAHFMSVGGLVEVIAQERKVHPENLADLLRRFPRDGFAPEAIRLIRQEVRRNPGGRFACLNPLFPMMVSRSAFSGEAPKR